MMIASDRATGPKVLIVEDEYLLALQCEMSLSDAGFEVVGIVSSADEAVKVAKVRQPELIIMDIRLAGTRDGVDAAVEIRKALGIRCLFASAHSDSATMRRAEAAEPLGWLAKPYTPDELVRRAAEALKKRS
jgi:DNA-binding NarL/FixJ family response regulator